MASKMQLTNFNQLIQPLLSNDKTYVSHNCERLLSTGENYGSVMLKVEVTVKDEDGAEEIIHCVAKTPPPKSWIWELFTTVVTFKKEISFYRDIAPTLENFANEKNLPNLIDFTAKYYGSRVNLLENSDNVDEDAVLVLENLKISGYSVADRFTGFDLHTSKLIIRNMAVLHATTIAYRQNYPKEFEDNLLPPISAKFRQSDNKEMARELADAYVHILTPLGIDTDLYREKLVQNFFNRMDSLSQPVEVNSFFTLVHFDLWTNNIMLKVENGQTTDVKFVDFQVLRYLPGAHDLVFFLYTSVELPILTEQLDNLVDYYFETFLSTLESLQARTNEFTKSKFMELVNYAARNELGHILLLLGPIFTKKENAKELHEFSPEDFKPKFENVHENFAPRLHFIVSDCINREWI